MNKPTLLIALLRQISDISLYIAISGILLALMKSTTPIFIQVLLILFASCVSFYLRKTKFLKYIPIILSFSVIYFTAKGKCAVNVVWLVPILVYELTVHIKGLYYCNRRSFANIFRYAVWFSALLGIAGSGLSLTLGGDNGAAVFAGVFMISGMLLLKYSRQNSDLLGNAYYNGVNIVSALLIVLFGCIISLLIKATYFLFKTAIQTILDIDSENIIALKSEEVQMSLPSPSPSATLQESVSSYIPESTEQAHDKSGIVGIIIAVALLLAVIVYIMKKRSGNKSVALLTEKTKDEEVKGKHERHNKHIPLNVKGNRLAVRKCYKKFMLLCRNKNFP